MEDLAGRARLCVLGTQGSRGPHLVPIWFVYREGNFEMVTGEDRQKLANLECDARAGLAMMADAGSPALMVDGVAEVTPEGVGELMREIAVRYLGETAATRYLDELYAVRPPERLRRVVLRPTWWKSWEVE